MSWENGGLCKRVSWDGCGIALAADFLLLGSDVGFVSLLSQFIADSFLAIAFNSQAIAPVCI